MNALNNRISQIGVVPVIKLNHPERDAAALGRALCAGGVPVAEITFRAAGADKAIRLMKDACPDMLVGAGTVTATSQIDAVIEAGGDFIVSPGFDPELVAYAQEKGIAVYPGCTTASEYHQALKFGLEVIKFFPAEQSGGLAKIKALAAPFPMFKVMPTGGISLKNLEEYLSCPVIAACGGSYMVKPDDVDNGNWEKIIDLCKQTRAIVDRVRP
jgi:2-dehydro-3-deoxyphosphogluconate aldolase/(4S)-4-hydroxy-2-oxoglutarate aldolase